MKQSLHDSLDGSHTVFSNKYNAHYHSIYGALDESIHVFIVAGLYHLQRQNKKSISILEMGFGTGLNAFMTWLESEKTKHQIQYTAIEAFPISLEEAADLNYAPSLQQDASKFLKLHNSPWEESIALSNNFSFIKNKIKFEELDFQSQFDIIYFDAFAPNAQPELWETNILQKMYDALKPEGILVTYSAKGSVRRAMQSVGFTVERLPGPPGKREMLRATKTGAQHSATSKK